MLKLANGSVLVNGEDYENDARRNIPAASRAVGSKRERKRRLPAPSFRRLPILLRLIGG
jgi:hypothetical protein